ncbi:hypothetical protein JOE11_001780 [Robbsia andropogonis]|uniref:hypothetical protein n=1 Tax=Robbsia andropogonis TaxID=28092 RepID=UPI002A6A6F23|nr:hypothetical protein [Robbsia andropogonis]
MFGNLIKIDGTALETASLHAAVNFTAIYCVWQKNDANAHIRGVSGRISRNGSLRRDHHGIQHGGKHGDCLVNHPPLTKRVVIVHGNRRHATSALNCYFASGNAYAIT